MRQIKEKGRLFIKLVEITTLIDRAPDDLTVARGKGCNVPKYILPVYPFEVCVGSGKPPTNIGEVNNQVTGICSGPCRSPLVLNLHINSVVGDKSLTWDGNNVNLFSPL